MNTDEQLKRLDAIEIQLGQGAQAAAPMGTRSWQIDETFRKRFNLAEGEDARIHTRLPGMNRVEDFPPLVRELRERYGVPVGLKTCATHYLEREIDVALEGGIDYIVVDGAEAGTHGGPTILQDDVGLPTLHALARTVRHLERRGVKRDVSVIAAGGLTTPGHFLKAMALGADAVYIGSIALVAMLQTQMNIASPFEPPVQTVLYHGKFKEDIDVEKGAEHLAKFLKSCVEEMKNGGLRPGQDGSQSDRPERPGLRRSGAGPPSGCRLRGAAPGGATSGLDGREGSLGFCQTRSGRARAGEGGRGPAAGSLKKPCGPWSSPKNVDT